MGRVGRVALEVPGNPCHPWVPAVLAVQLGLQHIIVNRVEWCSKSFESDMFIYVIDH